MTDNTAKIREALVLLDVSNTDHWTGDGLPRIDALLTLTGIKYIKRAEITDASPGFTREAPVLSELVDAVPDRLDDIYPTPDAPEAEQAQDSVEERRAPTNEDLVRLGHMAPELTPLEQAEKRLEIMRQASAEIARELALAEQAHDDLIVETVGKADPQTLMHDIQGYLESQKALRHQRAGQAATARELLAQAGGVLTVKSRLDQAIASQPKMRVLPSKGV